MCFFCFGTGFENIILSQICGQDDGTAFQSNYIFPTVEIHPETSERSDPGEPLGEEKTQVISLVGACRFSQAHLEGPEGPGGISLISTTSSGSFWCKEALDLHGAPSGGLRSSTHLKGWAQKLICWNLMGWVPHGFFDCRRTSEERHQWDKATVQAWLSAHVLHTNVPWDTRPHHCSIWWNVMRVNEGAACLVQFLLRFF